MSPASRLRACVYIVLGLSGCLCALDPDPGGTTAGSAETPATAATATHAAQPEATGTVSAPAPNLAPLSTAVPCGARAPAPWPLTDPALGPWGEDRGTAPDFGYTQERRAPKMPDGG